jgi:sugar lactone lactonase YvrE
MLRYLKLVGLLCSLLVFAGCGDDNNLPARYLQGGSIQGLPASITGAVTTLAGTAGVVGSLDGTGAAASFSSPNRMTTDGANLYVTDWAAHTIRKIVIATGVVTTLAGTAGISGSTDGTGAAARFLNPQGITTDGINLYVTDENYLIRKIVIATGAVTTIAGTAGVAGSADGTGAAATFNTPRGITTDGANLYVADSGNDTIRKMVIATSVVTTLAGTPLTPGFTDGTGAAALFSNPIGITTDGFNLYLADYGNNTIRKIVIATAVVTTLAGNAAVPAGSADGTGATALFNSPDAVTTDGTNLYVADNGNNTIRKIVTATGVVTTIAGASGAPAGSADGTDGAARFNGPAGITTDGTNLYVADSNNSTIRKIQ